MYGFLCRRADDLRRRVPGYGNGQRELWRLRDDVCGRSGVQRGFVHDELRQRVERLFGDLS